MFKRTWTALCALCFLVCGTAQAQNGLWQEYEKLIDSREAIGAMGPTLLGDSVNYYTGALQFSTTDVELPGNFSLPVAVTRKLTVGHGIGGEQYNNPFGDWDMDLPSISGVFSTSTGWTTVGGRRCSAPGAPPVILIGNNNDFQPSEYWSGTQLNLPGGGGGELLAASRNGGEILAAPTGRTRPGAGGPYYWLTSDWTYFSCLPTIQNGSGEGFQAITASGTKYRFDYMASTGEKSLKKVRRGHWATGYDYVYRRRYALYATYVEDRFGNSVTYNYSTSPSGGIKVNYILASDGRRLDFMYDADGHVTRVTAGSQAWNYVYAAAESRSGTLTSDHALAEVILPDDGPGNQSRWKIEFGPLSAASIAYMDHEPGVQHRTCFDPGDVDERERVGTITHPSGAVGTFTVAATRFARSNVLAMCSNVTVAATYEFGGWQYTTPPDDPNDDSAYYPIRWDSYALTRKQVSGPGLPPAEWNYRYYSAASWFLAPSGNGLPVCTAGDCVSPQCVTDSCAGQAVAEVWGPENSFTRYTFGNSYRYNEGKLLLTEQGTAPAAFQMPTSILKKTTAAYQLAQSGQVFPTPIGISPQLRSGAGFSSEYLRPQSRTLIEQDGASFTNEVTLFDRFSRPTSTNQFNSLGRNRAQTTEYHNDLNTWVLGQVKRTTINGTETSRTDYDASTALPLANYSFGKLQNTLTHNTTAAVSTGQRGTLATVKDGLDNVTTLSNWKRGIPQLIQHPATPESPSGATESAVVNDDGTLASVTDEAGSKACYTYDDMGRLASITYPSESAVGVCDASIWATTNQSFTHVAAVEYGIPAGHWRQLVTTGNARRFTYFDGFWRPLLTLEYDAADFSGTKRFTRREYDASGHEKFVSYPGATDTLTLGVRTTYDALDRVIQVDQDNELGSAPLRTKTEYLSGFQRKTTNPRGFSTVEQFDAYDVPTYDAPAVINAPQGVSTVIERNAFGRPVTVTRSGPDS